jgi:DNA-binding response OmpR family regulator
VDPATTLRSTTAPKRILVVHDVRYDIHEHYQAIIREFVLRVATMIPEAVEAARNAPFACIVCLMGGDIEGKTLHAELARADSGQARALLLVRTPDITPDDDVFLLTAGVSWVALPLSPNELLASVRRMVVDGHI